MSSYVVGILKEVKAQEGRVAMTPHLAQHLINELGATVAIETGAGEQSGYADTQYARVGAIVVSHARDIWANSEIVLKVKEPTPLEYPYLKLMAGKILFTYLHLAGSPVQLTKELLECKITAIAYEGVTTVDVSGRTVYPLLAPMSKIAGEQSVIQAIEAQSYEIGELTMIVIGGGNVGVSAIDKALRLGVQNIVVFEAYTPRIAELKSIYALKMGRVTILPQSDLDEKIGRHVLSQADILICGPMRPGGVAAPIVLHQKHFRHMAEHAYVVDVAIDQGGSTAWTKGRPTNPGEVFERGARKIRFSATPNIPGSRAAPQATEALSEATFPYVEHMAYALLSNGGLRKAFHDDASLRAGIQTHEGYVLNRSLESHFKELGTHFPYCFVLF
jgi:alanine dehydrogenase